VVAVREYDREFEPSRYLISVVPAGWEIGLGNRYLMHRDSPDVGERGLTYFNATINGLREAIRVGRGVAKYHGITEIYVVSSEYGELSVKHQGGFVKR
jgi:hypothetical protein